MKIKYLMIVGLILAILTIGAVSASDDMALDDSLEAGDAIDEIGDSNPEIISDDGEWDFIAADENPTSDYEFDINVTNYYGGSYYQYADTIAYLITLPSDATGNLTLTVNDQTYDVKYKDGRATAFFFTDDWNLGNNTAVAKYSGDGKYSNSSCQVTVEILPKVSYSCLSLGGDTNLTMAVGEKDYISFIAPGKTSGKVEIIIVDGNGTIIDSKNITVSNGYGSYSLSHLAEGTYVVRINGQIANFNINRTFNAVVINNSGRFTSSISQSEITVGNEVSVIICAPFETMAYLFIDDTFIKMIYIFDEQINEVITGLAVGSHKIKIQAYDYKSGDSYMNTFTVNVKEKPAPAPAADSVKLTLNKAKVKKSAKKLVLTSTLKVNGKAKKGLVVKFKFNKKTYTAKTDAKGIAKVTIKKSVLKKLKAGKKITYQASYGKTVKKITVKVKK